MIDDLSFSELRLANLVHPHPQEGKDVLGAALPILEQLNDVTLAQALAELIIQADWLAAAKGVDLVQAIRNRFAVGGNAHGMARTRPSS